MWSAIGAAFLGVIGWMVTSFFGKPFLDFLTLRSRVHEEIIFTGNAGPMTVGTPLYDQALSRCGVSGLKCRQPTSPHRYSCDGSLPDGDMTSRRLEPI
jgi:hypothetical protein